MCMHMRDFDGAFMIRLFHKLACRLITSSLRLRSPWGGGGGGGRGIAHIPLSVSLYFFHTPVNARNSMTLFSFNDLLKG